MMESKVSRTDTATARSQVYGLLAAVFRAEPDEGLIEDLRGSRFAGAFASLDTDFGDDFQQTTGEELRENLAVEFTRLFMGPGEHISPHESVFVDMDGDAGGLYGAKTVEVKKFIEATGLSYDEAFTGLPDHVSVELEFMGKLAGFESEKWANGEEDAARYCLSVQKMFAEKHLLWWIPEFCARVITEANLSFYREMARFTDEFLDFDYESMEGSVN
jgi:TorA maturation chaperone TorD